jgi:hypothetical protein
VTRALGIGIILWAALALPAASAADGPLPLLGLGAQQPVRPHPAVVRVVAPGRSSISYGSGTLVAVSGQHGLVITNWHVINEATGPISVVFPDGFQSNASVLKIDRDWDLAALAIWKPRAQPVPLAAAAPRTGDTLTIAGYGSGAYREASGRCTQYVAPGTRFPYEMVELAASARQGDSGGPIFNDRGELAGVLFGEGHGRTTGSYCGRVQWFLSSVAPPRAADGPAYAAIAGQPNGSGRRDARPTPPRQEAGPTPPVRQNGGFTASAPAPSASASDSRASADRRPPSSSGQPLAQAGAGKDEWTPRPAPPAGSAPGLPPVGGFSSGRSQGVQRIGWHDIAGETTGEQIKSVLAGIGGLAIVLHALAWLSRDRQA